MQRCPLALVSLLGLALALGACASGGSGELRGGEPFVAAAGADGVQRATVDAGSYFFAPSRIVVKANLPVELTLRKKSWLIPHSFVLEAPEAGIAVAEDLSSEPTIVRFTPTRAGSYPFFCSKRLLIFPSHREQGMEGVLEVRP
jgi:plastocyanin